MNICVAGWYFRRPFLETLKASAYDVFVVQHRDGDTCGLPAMQYENRGLEFGCYRKYIDHHWDKTSDVLFCHDDTDIAGPSVLDDIRTLADIGVEQAYIFHDENDEYINGGAHGRGIWIRGDIIAKLAHDFPADMENCGVNIGTIAQRGIFAFHERIMAAGRNTGVIAIHPGIRYAHRGRLHDSMFVFRKTGPVPGGLVCTKESD